MPENLIGSAIASDLTNTITSYSVDSQDTDGLQDQKETTYQNTDWSQHLGYYKEIPELRTAVDAKTNWVVGAGFDTDEMTSILLDNVDGSSKDSFLSVIHNALRTYTLTGDSFCEIIRNNDGMFINLKILDPSSIVVVANRRGRIIRYEQVNKHKKPNKKFKPEDILHLSRNRIADEIHGTGVIESVEWIILARNEAMNDWKRVLHRNVDPLWVIHLDTDDTTEINSYKSKYDTARANGENMYVPKGVVVPEQVTTSVNATLNPLAWINQLNDYFFQAVNVPQIIIGNAKEFTDASSKIVYLAFEQSVKAEQIYLEEQLLKQLNIKIELKFPASLQQDLISGEMKQPSMQPGKPNDGMVEMEGRQ